MAKRFNFRLDPVLRLRSHIVRQAEESLMEVVNIRIEKEKKILELEKYYVELLEIKAKSSSAEVLQASHYHKSFIMDEIKKLEKEKSQIIEIENIRRSKLTEALKNEKILEKLKEKKREEYKKNLLDEENKELNEIATNRHYDSVKSE